MPADIDARMSAIVDLARERDRKRAELRVSRPCWPSLRDSGGNSGARAAAVDACEAAGGWRNGDCGFYEGFYDESGTDCPRRAEELAFQRRCSVARLAGIPQRPSRLVLSAYRGRRQQDRAAVQPQPLEETAALQIMRAVVGKRAATVADGGRAITVAGDETMVVLAGRPGCGKSVAAAWAIVAVNAGGMFLSAPVLGRVAVGEDASDPMLDALEADVLVLDDLGCEHSGATGWAVSRVQELICARHADEKLTLVTTNLNRADFGERYGARVLDRIAEGGLFAELHGPSLRGSR